MHASSRIKCDQYWPVRGTENYGVMSVTLTDTQELATYTIRTFQLQRVSAINVSRAPTQNIKVYWTYTNTSPTNTHARDLSS